MVNLKLYPYVIGSESARDLAELLEIKQLKHSSTTYVPRYGQVVLNWGNGKVPMWMDKARARQVKLLNAPGSVNTAANKLSALQALQSAGVRIPEFTTNIRTAQGWLYAGATVVERHELRGNSGAGIRIVNNTDDEMPNTLNAAPLYTKFLSKQAEFRVHVFKGEVIDYIEKKKVSSERRDATFNAYISSINSGWVFCRTDVRDLPEVRTIAIRAVQALGLDFGAVDVVLSDGLPFVLEVNTAPGLAGTTLVKYANAIRRYMGVSDLPATVTSPIMDRVEQTRVATQVHTSRPVAARVAQDDTDMVTLKIDRAFARQLHSLLLQLA